MLSKREKAERDLARRLLLYIEVIRYYYPFERHPLVLFLVSAPPKGFKLL